MCFSFYNLYLTFIYLFVGGFSKTILKESRGDESEPVTMMWNENDELKDVKTLRRSEGNCSVIMIFWPISTCNNCHVSHCLLENVNLKCRSRYIVGTFVGFLRFDTQLWCKWAHQWLLGLLLPLYLFCNSRPEGASPGSPAARRSRRRWWGPRGIFPGSLWTAQLSGGEWSWGRRRPVEERFLERKPGGTRPASPPSVLWPGGSQETGSSGELRRWEWGFLKRTQSYVRC